MEDIHVAIARCRVSKQISFVFDAVEVLTVRFLQALFIDNCCVELYCV